MKKFKEMVKCVRCNRRPHSGENIDDWLVDQETKNIDLVCTECMYQEMGEKQS